MVLSPGMKARDWKQQPDEMDYINSSDSMRDKILAGFRISKTICGISTEVNRASMDGAMVNFAEECMNPVTHMMGANATEKLAWRWDKKLCIAWMSMTPDDATQKLAQQQADVAAGARVPNEIRKERGLEPYKNGGDDPILPMGMAPMPMNTGMDLSGLSQLMPGGDQQQQQDGVDASEGAASDEVGVGDQPGGPHRVAAFFKNGHTDSFPNGWSPPKDYMDGKRKAVEELSAKATATLDKIQELPQAVYENKFVLEQYLEKVDEKISKMQSEMASTLNAVGDALKNMNEAIQETKKETEKKRKKVVKRDAKGFITEIAEE